jgi:RNA recognition motif-containing protein
MAKKIYVGNLSFATTGPQLAALFSAVGKVDSAEVVEDLYTGRSKGFGFVIMATEEQAETAIRKLNGTDLGGRLITVGEARPQNGTALRYANGYGSGKSGFGSDYYGTIYGSEQSRRRSW